MEKLKIGPPPECPCKDPKCPKKPVKEEKKEVEPKEDLGQCAMKSKIFFFNVPNHPMPNHPMANAQPLNAPNLQSYSVHLAFSVVNNQLNLALFSKLNSFWAAAPKGRCPVGHRGGFPDVRPSVLPSVLPSPPLGLNFALSGLILF